MKYTRHHPIPGRPTLRPPFPPVSENSLPFLQETGGGAGHDLLLLNARPDLAPRQPADPEFEETGSTTAFLQRCFAGFQI